MDLVVILVACLILMRVGVLRVDLFRASEGPKDDGQRDDRGAKRKGGEGAQEEFDPEKGAAREHIGETLPLIVQKKD